MGRMRITRPSWQGGPQAEPARKPDGEDSAATGSPAATTVPPCRATNQHPLHVSTVTQPLDSAGEALADLAADRVPEAAGLDQAR
jgi:hypothetical protein